MAAETRRGWERSPKASAADGHNPRPNHGQSLPPTRESVGEVVRFHLRDDSPKQIVRRIKETSGVNVATETARNWKREDRGVSDVVNFLLLCRAYPALAAEANRLVAMEADLDPAFERAFQAFLQAWHAMRPK